MRLRCEYKTDKIPVCYQMMFVSLIKESLKKTDKDYFSKVYNFAGKKSNKKAKNFTFSVYMKGFEKKEDVFVINDRVIFNISSPDYEFMIKLYNGLLQIKTFEYKEFSINKVRISLVKDKVIDKESVVFNTLSPICIKDKSKNTLEIEDENYVKELNYITNKVLESYRGYGLSRELKFKPLNMKKKVVKEDIRNFRQNTNKSYYYVNSFGGTFSLEGDIKDLKDIYLLGIGFKRSQGFGMIEVIG